MKPLIFILLLTLGCGVHLHAATPDSLRSVEHQWLYGASHANILDTYLSPYDYTGIALSAHLRTERPARFGHGNLSVVATYRGQIATLQSPSDDGKEWDGNVEAAGGTLYNFHPSSRWRIGIGPLLGGGLGFTYNDRNGNNPAQARLYAHLLGHVVADYHFRLFRRSVVWRTECQMPLLGVAFAPQYGQSYYEIFSLGHYNKNCVVSYPFNAPSWHFSTLLSVSLKRSTLNIGFQSDVKQSRFHHLKRHAWFNGFTIGYTRNICLIR